MTEILYEKEQNVARVTISNPAKKNAINHAGWAKLKEVLEDFEGSEARCLVIAGQGEDFSSGADLGDFPSDTPDRLKRMKLIGEVIVKLFNCPKPTIAMVKGVCVGASLGLALACDFVIAARSSRFSQIFVKRGLAVDGGTSWLVPRLVGLRKAKELALLGDFVDAPEAERMGLITRCVEDEKLEEETNALSVRLAKGPGVAISLTKDLLSRSFEKDLLKACDDEAVAQCVVFNTADVVEAMRAFAEKREPNFLGR